MQRGTSTLSLQSGDFDAESTLQAAARLQGMDICKVLNLDSTGIIHQVVLARSLHIFDQAIFTPTVCQELVDILASMCPDRTDGRVPLQTFVDLLGHPEVERMLKKQVAADERRYGRKPSRTGEYEGALEAYSDSLVCDIRGFKEVVNTEALANAAGTSPQEIEQLRATLRMKAKEYVIDAQRRHICPLWELFDKDGNGVLDPKECTNLVAAYLRTMSHKASEVIRGSIELGIELSIIVTEKTVKDEVVRQKMRDHAKLQVEAIHANVAPMVEQMMAKMAQEDAAQIAGELLASLDLNKDGKVTRNEFEIRFVDSMQYVLGPEGLMDKLQKVNSLT